MYVPLYVLKTAKSALKESVHNPSEPMVSTTSCNELIPLVLDEELIHFMLESMLKNASDLSDAKMLNKEAIRKQLVADSGAHPVPCIGLHGSDCRIYTGGFMVLDDLLGDQRSP